MDAPRAITLLSALAQPTRLAAIKVLVARGEEGMRSSEVAELIGTPHNTMSVHLAVLSRAGLVSSVRSGREAIYRVEAGAIADLSGFIARLAVSS